MGFYSSENSRFWAIVIWALCFKFLANTITKHWWGICSLYWNHQVFVLKLAHLICQSIVHYLCCFKVRVMVFNATFNNISVISWRSVVLVEGTGELGENHRHAVSHWQTLANNVVSSTPHPCSFKFAFWSYIFFIINVC